MKKSLIVIGLVIIAISIVLISVFYSTNKKIGHFKGSKKAIYFADEISIERFIEQMIADSIITTEDDLSLATKIKSFKSPKPGRYIVQKGMKASDFISMLRAGNQSPLMVKVDGVRTIYQMAGRLGKQLRADSISFLNAMTDPKLLSKYGLDEYSASSLIFPNTYGDDSFESDSMFKGIDWDNFNQKLAEVKEAKDKEVTSDVEELLKSLEKSNPSKFHDTVNKLMGDDVEDK
jgi:UPF0755 protein